MTAESNRKRPPVWFFLIVVFTLFTLVSLRVTLQFGLPWIAPIPFLWSLFLGLIFLIPGFTIMVLALKELQTSRALGKEIYASKETSRLVTTGIYAYTRNPVYLAATLLFLGWFFMTRFTVLAIMTILFLILFIFVAKWEETELTDRFGDTYHHYKATVPFFIPYPKRRKTIPNDQKK